MDNARQSLGDSDLGSLMMGSFEAEKKENSVEDKSRCDATKGVHEQIELRLLETILLKPFEHFLLGHQITSINGWKATPEVDHSGKLSDAVLASVARVTNLDECDVQVVRFGINVFQFLQHLLALRAIVLIC